MNRDKDLVYKLGREPAIGMKWAGGRERASVIPLPYRQGGPGCGWTSSWDGLDLTAEESLAISLVFYNFHCIEARKAPGVKKRALMPVPALVLVLPRLLSPGFPIWPWSGHFVGFGLERACRPGSGGGGKAYLAEAMVPPLLKCFH